MLIGIKIAAPVWGEARLWPEYHLAKSLKRWLHEQGHEVRIDVRSEWYGKSDDLSLVLRGDAKYERKRERFVCLWNVTSVSLTESEIEDFDCVFACGDSELKSAPIVKLPHGVDHDVFFPDPDPIEHNVLYVGDSISPSIIHDFVKVTPVDVYGKSWEGTPIEPFIHGRQLSHNMLRKHFSGAKTVICENTLAMARTNAIPAQVFQAAACGAKVITNRVKGLEVFGGNVLSYQSPQDIMALIEKEINKEKLLTTIQDHTLEQRCRFIVGCLDSLY